MRSRRSFLDVLLFVFFCVWCLFLVIMGGRLFLRSNRLWEEEKHLKRIVRSGVLEKKVVQSLSYFFQESQNDLQYISHLFKEVVHDEWSILEFKEALAKNQLLFEHPLGFSFMKGRLPTVDELSRVSRYLRLMIFFMELTQDRHCEIGHVQFLSERTLFSNSSLRVKSHPLSFTLTGPYPQALLFLKKMIQKKTLFIEEIAFTHEAAQVTIYLRVSVREYAVL